MPRYRCCDLACCWRRRNAGTSMAAAAVSRDRKSTRLNSSHLVISYAVFCLKKKKQPPATHAAVLTEPVNDPELVLQGRAGVKWLLVLERAIDLVAYQQDTLHAAEHVQSLHS